MDRIDRDRSSTGGVIFRECIVWRLLFADDLALFSSNKSDLQYALDRFFDACLDAGMKISMAKTEIMCLSMPLSIDQTNGITLQQTEKFTYLGVIFSSDGTQDNEVHSRIRKASAVMLY